ncbi:MAG TPA: hypothetical protein VEJ63_21030 [Planctomycetota bacterium]|nr:hypothetical protein [Planctomycetota bacterium]
MSALASLIRIMSCVVVAAFAVGVSAGEPSSGSGAAKPGVVSNIKVLSDKVEDVSSMEAWKKSCIKDGMSDEEKALKIFETIVRYRHQCSPPNEYLIADGVHVHDAIKAFNVYGYGQCCCASSHLQQLGRYVGLKARGWAGNNHSIAELYFNNGWHMLDGSLCQYYSKDKHIFGVEELTADPAGRVNIAHNKFVDAQGWYPAKTHNIKDSVSTYAKKGNSPHVFEYGCSQSYKVNIQLREGERLTRNWSHKGLHVNRLEEPGNDWCLKLTPGQGEMAYQTAYGDVAPGRVGNGTHEYNVPLASGAFRTGALVVENIASKADDKQSPAIHLKDAAQPGVLIIRMPTSYIYLSGTVNFDAVAADGGTIAVSYSDNNGLDWKALTTVNASGPQKIDLTPHCYRRYDYRLKFEIKGKGTGLDSLKILHDVQHSQRVLPILAQGNNTITCSVGPQEGSINIEGIMNPEMKNKNLYVLDFKPVANGMNPPAYGWFMAGGQADVTYKVEAPGDIKRINVGAFYRARGTKDIWQYQVSFDEGKTFKTFHSTTPQVAGNTEYAIFSEVPAGTKTAHVRFAGTQNNTCGFFHHSVTADYAEPNGGFRPVKITYVWDENGAEKKDVHVMNKPDETYTINCAAKPLMKSISLELAE